MNKEPRYTEDGKELISKCSWCEKEGIETYMDENNQRITDMLDLWDIEDMLSRDIAVVSHGICMSCIETLYPNMCKDDNLTLLK